MWVGRGSRLSLGLIGPSLVQSRLLLLLALWALLCVSAAFASSAGEPTAESTRACSVDPTTGAEKCESIAAAQPSDVPVVDAASAEKAELSRQKAAARAKYDAEKALEREAKRDAMKKQKEKEDAERRAKQSELDEDGHRKGPSQDDYKFKEPLKKLKVNYYKFFGVDQDTPKLKIRKAVNIMAVANHPDKCATIECRENMVVINHARDVLLDDETREHYDFLLKYGFKVFDQNLYEDLWAQYQKDPNDMPNNFYHVDRGWSFSEEEAGWVLAITGLFTLAMLAWPVVKFWKKSTNAEAKKAAAKKQLLETQQRVKQEIHFIQSLKKKTEKFAADKKTTEGSPAPSSSPSASSKNAKQTR